MNVANRTVVEAKARLRVLLERLRASGHRTITERRRSSTAIVSAEEGERKTKRAGNLAEFFADSPLRGSGIEIEREESRPRDIAL